MRGCGSIEPVAGLLSVAFAGTLSRGFSGRPAA